jgi:hypothetical protein
MNHSDRNALFGILAVQMNFRSRDALIAAMTPGSRPNTGRRAGSWSSRGPSVRPGTTCSSGSSTRTWPSTRAMPSGAWRPPTASA